MASITELKASVMRNTEVVASALLLINGLAERFAAAGTDAERAALIAEITTQADALASAVAANTPVVVAPPEASRR